MLERWNIASPELCRVVEEFEGVQNIFDELPHHQEGIDHSVDFSAMSEI